MMPYNTIICKLLKKTMTMIDVMMKAPLCSRNVFLLVCFFVLLCFVLFLFFSFFIFLSLTFCARFRFVSVYFVSLPQCLFCSFSFVNQTSL